MTLSFEFPATLPELGDAIISGKAYFSHAERQWDDAEDILVGLADDSEALLFSPAELDASSAEFTRLAILAHLREHTPDAEESRRILRDEAAEADAQAERDLS